MNRISKDFKKFAKSKLNISETDFESYHKIQSEIYGSMTPYIVEEREMRFTQMDIFSRLMRDRILWINGNVNDYMSSTVHAQILYLSSVSDDEITLYIDTPGGSVKAGLTMVDAMTLCNPDIKTINAGMAASMGSVLLGAGTKGKRFMLPSSRVMLHQVSSGMEGNIQDIRISLKESEKYNDKLFKLLGGYCDKDPKQVMVDANRDLWLDAEETLAYGLIDEIITKK